MLTFQRFSVLGCFSISDIGPRRRLEVCSRFDIYKQAVALAEYFSVAAFDLTSDR